MTDISLSPNARILVDNLFRTQRPRPIDIVAGHQLTEVAETALCELTNAGIVKIAGHLPGPRSIQAMVDRDNLPFSRRNPIKSISPPWELDLCRDIVSDRINVL